MMKYKIVKQYNNIMNDVIYVVYEKSFLFWERVDFRMSNDSANNLILKLKEMRKNYD